MKNYLAMIPIIMLSGCAANYQSVETPDAAKVTLRDFTLTTEEFASMTTVALSTYGDGMACSEWKKIGSVTDRYDRQSFNVEPNRIVTYSANISLAGALCKVKFSLVHKPNTNYIITTDMIPTTTPECLVRVYEEVPYVEDGKEYIDTVTVPIINRMDSKSECGMHIDVTDKSLFSEKVVEKFDY